MIEFEEVAITDPRAQELLAEYFDDRAASFPAGQGNYSITFPDPTRFRTPDGVFLLVILGDTAVGCGGVRRLHDRPDDEVSPRFEVKHLWLQPQLRGTGSGRTLLHELETRALELGAHELVLDTNSSLSAAGGLYGSSGYREIEPYNDNPNANTWLGKSI